MNYIAQFNTTNRQIEFTEFVMQWTPNVGKPLAEIVPDTPERILVGMFVSNNSTVLWIRPPASAMASLVASLNSFLFRGFTVVGFAANQAIMVQDFSRQAMDAWQTFNSN